MRSRHRKSCSFQAFFHRELLPILEEFENTRKKRLPLLAGLFLLLNSIAIFIATMLTPFIWSKWLVLQMLTLLASAGVLLAGRLGWRGLDKTRDKAPLLFQGVLLCALLLGIFAIPPRIHLGSIAVNWFLFLLFIGLTCAGGLLGILDNAWFNRVERRMRFSRDVIAPLVNFAAPSLRFAPFAGVKQGDFMESDLFPPIFNVFKTRDGFAGRRNGYNLSFSWLKVEMLHQNANERTIRREFVFRGWYFVATFPRRFHRQTMVLPDVAEKNLGWLGRSLQEFRIPPNGRLIHLEDMDFEKRFKVFSTGELDGRYILTPVVMRRFSSIHQRMGWDFSVSFKYNRMYVAVPAAMEYFGFIPNMSFTDPAFARGLYHTVKGIDELARLIASTQTIWSDNAPL